MPTAKPRIQITIPPERYELLKRLAAAQSVSMSALVLDVLEPAYPVLERVCVVLEAAKRAKESSKEGMREAMNRAEAEVLPYLVEAVEQFDMFMGDAASVVGASLDAFPESSKFIKEAMESSRQGAADRPAAARTEDGGDRLDPPLVTRGSGSTKKGTPNATQALQKPSATRGSKK